MNENTIRHTLSTKEAREVDFQLAIREPQNVISWSYARRLLQRPKGVLVLLCRALRVCRTKKPEFLADEITICVIGTDQRIEAFREEGYLFRDAGYIVWQPICLYYKAGA